jgi:uncharacterized membrane protein YuzA (DUF378 family)
MKQLLVRILAIYGGVTLLFQVCNLILGLAALWLLMPPGKGFFE